MRKIFTPILSFLLSCAFGQDTTYRDEEGRKVNSFELCQYYYVVTKDNIDSNNAISRGYYKSGQIKIEQNVFYKDKSSQFIGGRIKEWYDNGQLKRNYFYKGTINLDGEVLTYYKNGKLKRKELYNDGKLIEGHLYSEDEIEVPHSDFIQQAKFPGGNNELVSFLLSNLKYPKKASNNKIEGTVLVNFMVGKNGNISEVSVVKNLDNELDREAIRIVKKMPKWVPYIIDGEATTSYFVLPVAFQLTE